MEVVHSHAPELSVGEHVVLIGVPDESGALRLTSFGNGVFHRVKDASGKEVVGNYEREPLALVDCIGRPLPVEADIGDSALSWSSFVTVIRACRGG